MSAHTLDLEYAQSNFCTGGKKAAQQISETKKIFFFCLVDL